MTNLSLLFSFFICFWVLRGYRCEDNTTPTKTYEVLGDALTDEEISAILQQIDRELEWRGFNTSAEHILRAKRAIARRGRGQLKQGKCNVHEIIKSSPLCMCSQPRKQMVDVPASHHTDVITVPRCTEIERCTGPCMNPNMKCLPLEVEMVNIPVLAIRFDSQDNLVPNECATVAIERHLSCGCSCKIDWTDCNDKQVYVERECICRCKKSEKAIADCASQGKRWDETHCRCKCSHASYRECSSGLYFHPELCRCVAENEV